MAEIVGRGSQGIVVAINARTVAKKTNPKTALLEENAAKLLLTIDPDQLYTIYGTSFIERKNEGKVEIRMRNGGRALSEFIQAAWFFRPEINRSKLRPGQLETSQKSIDRFIPDLSKIKASLDDLQAWLPTMHATGLTHNDIGVQNLVWDGANVRLIDWGESTVDGTNDQKENDIRSLALIEEELDASKGIVNAAAAAAKEGGRRKAPTRRSKSKKKSKRTRRR